MRKACGHNTLFDRNIITCQSTNDIFFDDKRKLLLYFYDLQGIIANNVRNK